MNALAGMAIILLALLHPPHADGVTPRSSPALFESPVAHPTPTPSFRRTSSAPSTDPSLSFFPALNKPLWSAVFFLLLWEMAWKGVALWKAGRLNQKTWFVVLFIVNTGGILSIIYLLFFQKNLVTLRRPPSRKKS